MPCTASVGTPSSPQSFIICVARRARIATPKESTAATKVCRAIPRISYVLIDEHLFNYMDSSRLHPESLLPQLADLFRLLGDATRLRIVLVCLDGPVAVGGIAAALALPATLVSHHLRLLRAARLVKSERQGRHVLYSAADQHVAHMLQDMIEHIAEPHQESA